ncbi:hypothetical protein CPB83DRAFT_807708 [Crepidotus variabilis]|uniref:DNA-directed RNA polymerase III subunit RPC3 n=1 Tax=Crepidotus variabilis TaxID=179855 RepID=A0A9P6JSU8_9AGAR|nr:hypothetical protein CPB83DRAFT_807708 [Crepidotus variabilis]
MADNHTRNLCNELIHSHFGPSTAKLAKVLLTRGRLSFSHLLRFTGLKPRTARSCILALVQHNVLWHSKGDDEVEMFEFNVDECLVRLRFGRYIVLAQEIFGQMAGEIVQVVLDHGKLRSSDALSYLHIYDHKNISQHHQTFHKLVAGSYLKPATILSHLSPRDRIMKYEAEERRKITGFPTAKELRQVKEVAEARVRREDEGEEQIGLKRKSKDYAGPRPAKRKGAESEDVVDDSVYFKVNYEKFNIHIRNNLIEHAAAGKFNEGAATVLRAILRTTEATQLRLSEPRTAPTSLPNIMLQIPEDAKLSEGLVYSAKRTSNSTCVKDYMGMLSSADNPSTEGRASSFISYSTSKIQVEFDIVARRLRRNVIESIAREKHGTEGARVVRLLLDSGKLDEKQISKIVMMAAKDVRPLLVALSTDSLISTQEVPKSADRNPTRMFYLWYVDHPKAFSVILGNIYKTLSNIVARRRAEREDSEIAAVLEKRERSDVSQDENLLTRMERELLQRWKSKEQRLSVIEIRVEEMVFLLKDLAPLCNNEE